MSQVAEPGVLKVAIARRSSLVGLRGRENTKEPKRSFQSILAKDWPNGQMRPEEIKVPENIPDSEIGQFGVFHTMGIDRKSSWAWGCCG